MEGGTEFTSPCHLCLMWTQFTIYLNSMNSPKPAAVWLPSRLGPEYTKSSSDTAIVLPVAARARRGQLPAGAGHGSSE